MVIKSIGFRSLPISDKYPLKKHVLANSHGCLMNKDNEDYIAIGKYAVGWIKTGPKGILDQTYINSEETVNNIRVHYEKGVNYITYTY